VNWQKKYFETIIDHLRPKGAVLEVGFASVYAAERFQTYPLSHHTIIATDPDAAKRAREWAQKKTTVTVIQESWEKALPKLGVFDSIFFDDLNKEFGRQSLQKSSLMVEKGKKLIKSVKEQFPEITKIKYKDFELESFMAQAAPYQPEYMAKFLHELLSNQQISEGQYAKMLSKYGLERIESCLFHDIADPVLVFLQACLKKHMRKGSRFSWAAHVPISKFENPSFFEAIITNPQVDYQEMVIPIEPCQEYPYKEMLVGVVEYA